MARLFKGRVRGAHGFEKPLVIKRILPHLAADDQFVSMFIDEATITAQLIHPKIVQVFDLQADGKELFLVMEYVDGIDLLTLIRHRKKALQPIPTELAVHIACELLDALDFAHSARADDGVPLGIVHRDVSPGNVLISRRGDVKLTDFGIAHAAERRHKTQTGTLKGKYSYMSPEQIAGREIDARADLFSVGILLAEMLMFRRLFVAPNDLELLLMVREARIDRLDQYGTDIPAGLRDIVVRALSRDPSGRYDSASDLREALSDWLFAWGLRVRPTDIAALVPTPSLSISGAALATSDGAVAAPMREDLTISGPTTKAVRLAADEAAALGRELYESGEYPVVRIDDDDDDDIPIFVDGEDDDTPDYKGDFAATSPFTLLHRLCDNAMSGLLITRRDGILKEAYFVDGHPHFVRSNVMAERLGQYLVAHDVIGEEDLDKALLLMPHFGGRLGDTLVGLKLLRPLEAVRHLGDQVRDKVVDVCTWSSGEYEWYSDRVNPWPAVQLSLDTRSIMGMGARGLSHDFVSHWAHDIRDSFPQRQASVADDWELYRLGSSIAYVRDRSDGTTSVKHMLQRIAPHDRVSFLGVLYMLVKIGAITLRGARRG
jgi:hypothetical protein